MTRDEAIRQASNIQGWFTQADMENMWEIVSQKLPEGGLMVEVGSWKGRSSYIAAAVCQTKGAKLICIDSFRGLIPTDHSQWALYHGEGGYYQEGNNGSIVSQIRDNLKEFNQVEIWEGDSRELYKKLVDCSCDLIFIDGDHDMPILGEDLDNYYPKVKLGGYFFGHDYEIGNNVWVGVNPRFPQVDLYQTIWGVTKSE